MPGHRIIRLLVSILLVGVLTGCNPFSDARSMMDEYVERVARVLETEALLSPIESPDLFPRRRDRALPMPELDMGMLDFLSLYGCELQVVVGEKNSVLGRVMQPLNRLRYELRFIRAANDCLPETEDEELVVLLERAIKEKRASLPVAVWNATLGGEEVESLFTLSKGSYPVSAEGNPVSDLALEARQLNQAVSRILAGDVGVDLEFAGPVQQRWQAETRAGQLINSAQLLVTRLDDATALIRQRIEGRPLCLNGKPNNQSDIVQNMFFSIYIGKVQPYLSDVRQASQALMGPLTRLAEQQLAVMPEGFRPWYQRYLSEETDNSLWGRLDTAMMEHTRSWQNLLEQCGLRPGA
ncbi:DUF3080 domain-containing protein [Marinobacter salinexigens]|uniref:DUF3080 domain-containing protein n=1 Tax=Marinobacter salinexigens TaxID=2919747 RepID=A0A5B0VGK8_9GAMM|nr:DUF3080 domain-containing protein [Marinobacter salinexigens]KAA1173707.1 DUF3080 domain-containing protein [Marinobacter salinexigens]